MSEETSSEQAISLEDLQKLIETSIDSRLVGITEKLDRLGSTESLAKQLADLSDRININTPSSKGKEPGLDINKLLSEVGALIDQKLNEHDSAINQKLQGINTKKQKTLSRWLQPL